MTRTIVRLSALAVLLPALALAEPGSPANIEVQKVAEGVYAVLRTDPPGTMFEANSAFIVGGDDVVVIDGGSNPTSAREVLAAIRRITDKPVRLLIKTHWHDDHMMGSAVYREAFPGVEIVAHATAAEDMATQGVINRKQMMEQGAGFVEYLRGLVEKKQGFDGQPMTDEERESHISSIALAERYFAEPGKLQPLPPTLTFDDHMTIVRGDRKIDLLWLGRAHTRGDIVVHLPKEGIVFTGDLVAAPIPLIGSTSFPIDYGPTLEKLLALKASVYVLGHGPVMKDDSYVQLMVRLLASIRQQTEAAVARGETLEQARKSVDLSEFRKAMASDSKLRILLFNMYVAGPGVMRAYEQASGKP
jgi:glyoxylase-like metal-dependent hydrolase (beta-lactamase superfamily II)